LKGLLPVVASLLVSLVANAEQGPSGYITLTQDSFHVEEKADFEWNYTVGPTGFKSGWGLVLTDPVFHGMRWSKWGDLSIDPTACTPANTHQENSWGYITAVAILASTGNVVGITIDRSNCSLENGEVVCSSDAHENAYITLYLQDETPLREGDTIRLNVGDTQGCLQACQAGSEGDCSYCDDCGFEMPDRSFPQIGWPAAECFNAADPDDCTDLPPATFSVTSLTTPDSLYVTVPSQAIVGEPFAVKVALLDERGNAVESAIEPLELVLDDLPQLSVIESSYQLTQTDKGWHDFMVVALETGVLRIPVTSMKLDARSNPIEILEAPRTDNIYWGDIHVHHGYTYETADGYLEDLNHTYARDVVGLDVVAESQKAAGLEIDEEALWAELQNNCGAYTVENEYLVLLGWEWMGKFATFVTGERSIGHHNIYYDTCDGPYGTHDTEVMLSLDGQLGIWTWLDLVQSLHGINAVTVPHAMRYTGHNYKFVNHEYQTLAEIYSEWGDNSIWDERPIDTGSADTAGTESGSTDSKKKKDARARSLRTGEPVDTGNIGPDETMSLPADDGSTQDLLSRGLRVGWIAASDNHDGWMGNPRAEGNAPSGLGAYIAPTLTRSAIFDSMKARRTYATTGHRPILRFWVEEGGEVAALQGSEIVAKAPIFKWAYHGTGEGQILRLYRITIEEGESWERMSDLVHMTPDVPNASFIADWDGKNNEAWWIEVQQDDGYKAWSSPIWLTADCGRVGYTATDPLGACPETGAPNDDTGSEPPSQCLGCQGVPGLPTGIWTLAGLFGLVLRRR